MSDTQTKELAKSYEPASIEAKWYPYWEERGYFAAGKAAFPRFPVLQVYFS